MHLNRAVPVLSVPDVQRAVSVFRDVLGLEVVMDLGWVATLGSVDGPQISVMHEDATAACNPDLSLDVEDVDVAHARALELGLEIVHPITDEPWGVAALLRARRGRQRRQRPVALGDQPPGPRRRLSPRSRLAPDWQTLDAALRPAGRRGGSSPRGRPSGRSPRR